MIGMLAALILSITVAFAPGAGAGTGAEANAGAAPVESQVAAERGPGIAAMVAGVGSDRAEDLVDDAWAALSEQPRMSAVSMVNGGAVVLVVAFLVTLVTTPLARRVALRRGIIDRPNEARKIHREPIPYLGGLAVFAGIFVALMLAPWLSALRVGYVVTPIGVVVGLVAIMLAGLGDDVGGWDPRTKIAGQLVAAAGLAISEIGIEASRGALYPVFEALRGDHALSDDIISNFLGESLSWEQLYDLVSYWGGVALIGIFVLGFTNATNFIDGLDGLCSGTVGIFAVGVLIVSLLLMPLGTRVVDRETGVDAFDATSTVDLDLGESAEVEQELARAFTGPWKTEADIPRPIAERVDHPMMVARVVLAMALLGAVLGFLPWNFNPAVIFLGDCGSLMLGYVCAVLILMLGDAGRTDFVLAGLIIFALPIMDLMLAIVRRRLAGVSMTAADSEHLHHQVRRACGSVRKAVLTLYGVAILFAILGSGLVALVMADVQARVIYAVAIILFGFIGVLALKAARHRGGAAAAAR